MLRCVYGPPGSGKTTYINEHAGKDDLIFQFDSVYTAITNREAHTDPTEDQRHMVLAMRRAFLYTAHELQSNVWFTCCRLTDDIREELGDQCEYIELTATKEELYDRVDKDDTRPDKELEHQKIDDYFAWREEQDSLLRIQERKAKMQTDIMSRIESGVQYRNLTLDVRDADEGMIVEGYATTFNQPYQLYADNDMVINEQVDSMAFSEARMDDVIFQFDHVGRVYARTRNSTLEVTPDQKGLFIRADLSGTEEGRKLYEEIRDGYIDRMSFGFTVAEDKTEKTSNDPRTYLRTITKIGRLFDVSAVSMPANDFTGISARSYVDGILDKERADALAAEQRNRQKQKIRILLEVEHGS